MNSFTDAGMSATQQSELIGITVFLVLWGLGVILALGRADRGQ